EPRHRAGRSRQHAKTLRISWDILEQHCRWIGTLVHRLGERAHFKIPVSAGNSQKLARALDAGKKFPQVSMRAVVVIPDLDGSGIVHGLWTIIVERARLCPQVFPAQDKHAIVAGASLRPDERKARKRPLQPAAIVSDLHHEESSRPQKIPCPKQDPACEIQTVPPAVEREPR